MAFFSTRLRSLAGAVLVFPTTLHAKVVLGAPFQDSMVLQRQKPVAIFGTADTEESITVKINSQTVTGKSGPDGKWKIMLAPMEAGGPYELEVTGTNTLKCSDVMIGEVWFFSGQSNVANRISDEKYMETVQRDNFPLVRIKHNLDPWRKMESPGEIQFVSALAYFFAKELHLHTRVAVGVIVVAYPASRIQEYMDPTALQKNPDAVAEEDGASVKPGLHYNKEISLITGYTIRGAHWNQGESNWGYERYTRWLFSMLKNWRQAWGDDFFISVQQLPMISDDWHKPSDKPNLQNQLYAEIRQSQFDALTIPLTALVPTIDICDRDLHPRNKEQVGKRISLIARRFTLGENIVAQGPVFYKMEKAGKELILYFLNTGSGLTFANEAKELVGMAICGENGVYHWAQGTIEGDSLRLSSPEVPEPVKARYGWADCLSLEANLQNKEGWGAPTFRTETEHLPAGH